MSLAYQITPLKVSIKVSAPPIKKAWEMSRLINAALIDQGFCDLLLSNPAAALSQGCNGEIFELSPAETRFTLNARARSLKDFAASWVKFESGLLAARNVR